MNHLSHAGWPAGQHRCRRGPALRELLHRRGLDLGDQALVRLAAGLALGHVGDAGARPDKDQPLHPRPERQRDVQRDPPPHRIPDQRETTGRQRGHVFDHRVERDRTEPGGAAVTPDVGRQPSVAFRRRPLGLFCQRCLDLLPARPSVGEAVEQYE